MLCKDVMLTGVFECRKDTAVERCAQLMREQNIGFVPVIGDGGTLAGVVTDRDLVLRVMAEKRPGSTPIGEIMSAGPLLVCRPDDDLRSLEQHMAAERKSRAVVQDERGKVVGIISLSDIAQAERSASRTGRLLRELTHRESGMIVHP